jgi:hypothetical protein
MTDRWISACLNTSRRFCDSTMQITVLLLVMCCLSDLSHGQTQAHRSVPAMSPPRALDLSLDRLPPHFEGDSIPTIWQSLSRLKLVKSDYETETQYVSRVQSLSQKKLIGSVPLDGLIAIVIPCDYPDSIDFQCDVYDAERQVLSIESPIDEYQFLVRQDSGVKRPAGIAQNGFGARFPISKRDMTRYFVSAGVPAWYNAASKEPILTQINRRIEVSIDPGEAKLARGHIRELLIGRVSSPFVVESEQSIEAAKPSYPIETHMTLHTFHMDIVDVWFFNSITGTIYRKVAAGTIR